MGYRRKHNRRRGFHRIQNTGQFKTFFKDQGLYAANGTARKNLEHETRKYVASHVRELEADKDRTVLHTKSMYCQIQITRSNVEKNRMNYIQKTKAVAGFNTNPS